MRVSGLRGRYSPMNRATEDQAEAIRTYVAEARKRSGIFVLEVRWPVYIGPGCAAERGDICIIENGGIAVMVMPDGRIY